MVLAKGVSAGLRDGVEQPGLADSPSSPGVPASPRVAEVLIDFDDFVAPESFGPPATPLRDRYLSRGVSFLGGPGTDGGAVLNWRSNFSVTGFSGLNFLAFNAAVGTTVPNIFIAALPEWILFTNPVAAVSMLVGSATSAGHTIHMNAFNSANVTVASSSLVLGQALQPLSVSAPGIVRVEVGGSDVVVMVLDDLRFTPDLVVAARATSWGRIKASYR
jgi:hypothetical protein